MSLKDQIQEDLKQSLRQRDAERAGVLRMLKAAIRDTEIDLQRELDDQDVLAVLDKAAKQRRESIESYGQGGRADLVASEERELEIITAYLPEQMSEEQIRAAVQEAISELQAQGPKDMGRVMKHLMAELRGRADGKVINALVREALTQ